MRWPPTLTSVPCEAGNGVSSTTTGQPATLCICCVWPAVGVGFPPRRHASHTSARWKRRPLTQASVLCQCRWWRLDPPSSMWPCSSYLADLAGVILVIISQEWLVATSAPVKNANWNDQFVKKQTRKMHARCLYPVHACLLPQRYFMSAEQFLKFLVWELNRKWILSSVLCLDLSCPEKAMGSRKSVKCHSVCLVH